MRFMSKIESGSGVGVKNYLYMIFQYFCSLYFPLKVVFVLSIYQILWYFMFTDEGINNVSKK